LNGPVNVTLVNATAINVTENVTFSNGSVSIISTIFSVIGGGITADGYPTGFYAPNGSIISGGEYSPDNGTFCSIVMNPISNNNGSNGVKIYISLALIVLMNIFVL